MMIEILGYVSLAMIAMAFLGSSFFAIKQLVD